MQEEKNSGKILDLPILRRLFTFIIPYRLQFGLLVGLILLSAVLSPIIPLLIRQTLDQTISTGNYSELSFMFALMVGILLLQASINFTNIYLSGWLGQSIIRDIRVQLYEKILYLRLKFFDDTPIGRLITRTISDVETLSDIFSEGLASIAGDILQLTLIISVMFYTDWRLSLISLCTVPLMLVSTYIFKEKVKISFNEVRTAVASLSTFVQEHITGMNVVQIFGSEDSEYKKFQTINAKHRDANIRSILYYSIYFPVADVIAAMGIGLIVWFGSREILNEQISYGTLTAFIMFINLFFRPIRMLADRFNTLQMGVVSTDRILKLLDSQEYVANNGHYTPKELRGDVSFKNIWFAYNIPDYILKNISFEVKAGETIALVGATGAGKSSAINLLSRFYEIQQGEILIDGISLKEYELYQLRKKIGVVLQDVFLFSDTILNNITLGDATITRQQVEIAAKLVGANHFIENLPNSYDYNVMERGSTLSVGQRQLISFVRALVHNPKIMVLDEATSSVDTETEELIQQAIDQLMQGRTSIVIAHRLSTIQKANRILVFDKGEIKEQGTHQELLALNGYYTQLYQMQYNNLIL